MPRIDIPARSEQLRRQMTLKALFDITTSMDDLVAARWLENGEERQYAMPEYRERRWITPRG